MLASKLLGVVGIMAIYAAVNGRCLKAPAPIPIDEKPQCLPTWSQWQDKCYKKHNAFFTWEDGKQKCVDLGGVMVVPQSYEELQHLLNLFSYNWFYIGCNDIDVEGTWVCLDGDGTIDVHDKRWKRGQPSNRFNYQDCAIADDSGWETGGCNYQKVPLICQRSA